MARVLQIHNHYREPGGEDVVAEAERELLTSSGNEVIAVRRTNAAGGLGAMTQLAAYACNPISTRQIMRAAKESLPDVAHFHNTWYGISPTVIKSLRRMGIPSVVTIHNFRLMCANAQLLRDGKPCELCVGATPWHGVRHRCYRNHIAPSAAAAFGIQIHRVLGTWGNGVDHFLTPTAFLRDRLVDAGLPAERITVHSNFVADPGPRPAPPSASDRVAFVGRLSAEKGLSIALEAWRRGAPPGLRLAIVGDGPQRSELDSINDESIEYLGWLPRSDVGVLLASCRALLFPAIGLEVQGLGVLEAFAAGTPVVGSAIGGLGETISPLGDDWLVRPASVDALAEGLRRLSVDPFVDSGGKRAREIYEARHSPGPAQSRLERTYANCEKVNATTSHD